MTELPVEETRGGEGPGDWKTVPLPDPVKPPPGCTWEDYLEVPRPGGDG